MDGTSAGGRRKGAHLMSDNEGTISYQPTDGLSYDVAETKYWQKEELDKEIQRIFEICHGCRLCFKYCDTFPSLFNLIDNNYEGNIRRITAAETERILDTCFQCKLCEVNCPYTPRDKHPYMLDFPKMVDRFRAIRVKAQGLRLKDRFLANPDGSARLARASLGFANVANKLKPHRIFMEKMLGIHREKLLPDFASHTFENWAEKAGRISDTPGGEAVLFQTCFVQNNDPQLGIDTLAVFEKNQVDIRCAKGLCCCGMPAWEKGDLQSLQAQAKQNLGILLPFVEKGAKVIAINPTCSMMFRREYLHLVASEDREAARKVAAAVMDPSEFLWSIREEARFNTNFKSTPGGAVAYHAPCHLRAQAIGFRGRDLLRKIPGVKPVMVQECCGHNGTFAMTVDGFEPSKRIGKKAFDAMIETKSAIWSSDCPLAAIQFQQHAGVKPLHPMSILARAYREDGFDGKIK
jgi:glycerol-3-phosphate dehydrogenase subunit C